MKTIRSLNIKDKKAQLLLLDDNTTVQILCDEVVVSSSSGGTWENLKDDIWAQESLLKLEVDNYLKNRVIEKKLQSIAKDFF